MRDQAEQTDFPDHAEAAGWLGEFRWLAAACGLLLIGKTWFAWRLDLYSDEVFYWLASTRPALAYSDLPFLTALLAGLGSAPDPGNPLATRSLFLIAGSCLPLIVYWMALAWVGRRDALQAAFLSICIPIGGFFGLLAVPDVPMLLFGLLSLGFLARALQTDSPGCWLGAGIFMALGLCTHYRFALYPMAALMYVLLTGGGHWRRRGFWLGAGAAASGLLPLLWANLTGNLGSADFYFVERHPWRFDAMGLWHIPLQSLLVTPPLYALLLFSAWLTFNSRNSRERNSQQNSQDTHPELTGQNSQQNSQDTHPAKPCDYRHTRLLLWFSLPHLLAYALLAPWADANSTTAHWPLPGYFPLLVFAPEALRRTRSWLSRRWPMANARVLAGAIPAVGYAGALLAILGIGSQSLQTSLQPVLGAGVLSEKMAGWRGFSAHTAQLLAEDFGAAPVIVTDNYYTAAQLQYAGVAPDAYTLDTDKAVRDGRLRQFELWRRSGEFVRERTGEPMLFISEDSTLNVEQKHALLVRACAMATSLEQLGQLSQFDGDKRFSYYHGPAIIAPDSKSAAPCPYPPRAWIDQPLSGAELSGIAWVRGWAYNEDLGVAEVRIYLDGELVAEADYDLPRPDVVTATALSGDPNQPNLGFEAQLDTGGFHPGRHELAIGVIDSRGNETRHGNREVILVDDRP